jgi:hypothetical protein
MIQIMNFKIAAQTVISMFIVAILWASCQSSNAEDLRKVVDLSGYWRFSIGDDSSWASPDYDDSEWDRIRVSTSWENEGYNEYNGYAWYRKTFMAGPLTQNEPVYLMLGNIDDADEVYINGHLVGKTGSFPPNFQTAYNQQRKYMIPYEVLNFKAPNTIAVRVYDSHQGGGIVGGPIGIFRDEDIEYLDYVFSGSWKFKVGDDKAWTTASYNDSDWQKVNVPAKWASYGYPDYNGYGWYRKEFVLNKTFSDDELYICLGQIDDYDQVFLNGKFIGDIFTLKKQRRIKKGREYRAKRTYKIPKGLLKTRGTNILAIRVYDYTLDGGIYEGPLGIMTKSNHTKFTRKYSGWEYTHDSFWEYIFNL